MKPKMRFARAAGYAAPPRPTPRLLGGYATDPLLTGPAVRDVPVADSTDAVKHYMDESLAASILYRAAPSVTPDPETGIIPAIDASTYEKQLAATNGLYATIGSYYKAVNVRPQSDPLYVRWWLAWYGNTAVPSVVANGRAVTDDPAWAADNGIGISVAHYVNVHSIMGKRLNDAWTLLRKDPADVDHPLCCNLPIRVELNQNGDVLTQCQAGRNGRDLCDFNLGLSFVGSAQDGAGSENHDLTYDWNTFAWYDPPTPPGSVRGICRMTRALVPMKWFYDAAVDLLQRMIARDLGSSSSVPIATVSDAIGYTVLWNLYVGHRYHLLPAELEVFAANLPDMTQLAEIRNRAANAAVIHQTLGTMATLSGNPYLQAYAALMEAIVSVMPAAVAVEVDFFGRALPFALKAEMQRTPAQLAPFDPSGRFAAILRRPIPAVVKPDTGKTSLAKPFAIAALAVAAWKLLPLLRK